MGARIYVGNLPFRFGFNELKETFEKFGEVVEAVVVADKFSGRSKGFGFVTFASEESAQKAITEMDGKEVGGRNLKVNEAKPKRDSEERSESPKKESTTSESTESTTEQTQEPTEKSNDSISY